MPTSSRRLATIMYIHSVGYSAINRTYKLTIMKSELNPLFKVIALLPLFFFHISFSQDRKEIGNMVLEGVPETSQEIKLKIQQYQNTRSASFADWLPNDEGILMATRFGSTSQLHIVENPGGARKQITFFDEPVNNGTFCPSSNHKGFIFTKDIGGNEFSQLFWYDLNTGESEMISDGESVNFGVKWSNSGEKYAFTSTRRNKKDFDIYISNVASPEKAELKIDKGSGSWRTKDWSSDDSKIIVSQYLSVNKTNSFIFDLTTNELFQINNNELESVFSAFAFDLTGENIYAITDEDREFRTLMLYNIRTHKKSYITENIPWDVNGFTINKSLTKAAFIVNENGISQLYLMDTKTNQFDKVQNLPIGQITSIKFHPTKSEVAMVINTTKTPGDIYTIDVGTLEKQRWTFSEVGGLNTSNFPKPELIYYETFDEVNGKKRMIPAFVYKPQNAKGPFPVMIAIHGGPEGQYVPQFSLLISFHINEQGIAVIAPNVRGSRGYGKSYLKLDNGFNRENSVKDIGKLIEWIEKNPELDENRISVAGGSYGGYMVLASMVNFNDKIKCGIDVVGISNFVTFLENTQEYRRDLRRVEYGDERDPKMRAYLLSIAPANNAQMIKKPLFVIQGANDPRVPATESEQMVEAIRESNGNVWYMLAKDEGHGFRKKENVDIMTEAIAMFLKEYLLSE